MQCEPPRIPRFSNNEKHRLRSGHVPLNKFGFLIKKVSSPNCEQWGIVEDVHHSLVECVRYRKEREALLSSFKNNVLDFGTFQSMLSKPYSENAFKIYNFIQNLSKMGLY